VALYELANVGMSDILDDIGKKHESALEYTNNYKIK
jgi:hypothetical protein